MDVLVEKMLYPPAGSCKCQCDGGRVLYQSYSCAVMARSANCEGRAFWKSNRKFVGLKNIEEHCRMWPRAAVEQFKFSRRGTVHNDIVEAMESILKHNKYNFKN